MIKIVVTGTGSGEEKTAFICKILDGLSGFAVIQINADIFFTSISSEAEGAQADLLRNHGAVQVIHIQADPKDIPDSLDQSFCLLPLKIEGVIIEGPLSLRDFTKDIIIFLLDGTLKELDLKDEEAYIILVELKSEKNPIISNGEGSINLPLFYLDMNDENEWKKFMTYLRDLIDSLKT